MKKFVLASSIALSLFASGAFAQNIPGLTAGKQYIVLDVSPAQSAVPASEVPAGKTLVTEFFWYGCPHCFDMEPMINKLVQDEGSNVVFKRVPVVYPRWESGAKLFYTLQEMGILDKMHDKVFYTIHKEDNNIMDDQKARDAWLTKQGVDAAKFETIYNSFTVATKLNQGKAYLATYKVLGTPTFVVNNKFSISPTTVAAPGLSEDQTYQNTIKDLKIIIDATHK
jgi:protein dithiol oxidoreductase (disulfide-forming)